MCFCKWRRKIAIIEIGSSLIFKFVHLGFKSKQKFRFGKWNMLIFQIQVMIKLFQFNIGLILCWELLNLYTNEWLMIGSVTQNQLILKVWNMYEIFTRYWTETFYNEHRTCNNSMYWVLKWLQNDWKSNCSWRTPFKKR